MLEYIAARRSELKERGLSRAASNWSHHWEIKSSSLQQMPALLLALCWRLGNGRERYCHDLDSVSSRYYLIDPIRADFPSIGEPID